jgi:hypothetical protein
LHRLVAFNDPRTVPGATVTSMRRTLGGNQAVGGVPNSRHLSGDAADFAPAHGQSLQHLASELQRIYPDAHVLIESDHVHVSRHGWGLPFFGRRGAR